MGAAKLHRRSLTNSSLTRVDKEILSDPSGWITLMTLQYMRTLELKELSVPVDKLSQLKAFYRIIASDERSTVVLKPKGN